MSPSPFVFMVLTILIPIQTRRVLSHFEGKPGDSDVFRNPKCDDEMWAKGTCNCATFGAECVRSDCLQCKCRKKARIYRSDVHKCLSDIEARDPWCRYQFLDTGPSVIPTIDLSISCSKDNKPCSQPINAPFDKTKSRCRVSWVMNLHNGTWHENSVQKFQETFKLRDSDYFADQGYMYRLEWKTSHDSYIPRRMFQVSLECLDSDSMKESYCLMFRIKGKGEPLLKASETRLNTKRPRTKKFTVPSVRPTRSIRRRGNTQVSKVVVVNDNFAVILAAIAGALGTALVVIPLAFFFRRNSRRPSRKCVTRHCPEHQSFEEGVDEDPGTSEETLSSYTSLKRNRENDEPPSIYQSLNHESDNDLPIEEPIYISVSGDEDDEPVVPRPPPPIYHVLEELEHEMNGNDGV